MYNKIFRVNTIIDGNNITIAASVTGVYSGGGILARVSRINIVTKEYNFYQSSGRNAYIPRIDFMVDTTDINAQASLEVNFYVSTSRATLLQDSIANGVIMGNGNLETFPYTAFYPYEATASRVWHPVYFQAEGECVQFQITMSDQQMMTVISVADSHGGFSYTGPTFVDFQLNAICIFAQSTSNRFQ